MGTWSIKSTRQKYPKKLDVRDRGEACEPGGSVALAGEQSPWGSEVGWWQCSAEVEVLPEAR